ncbi:MAG: zf-HC2 domain-containing protein [Deferribacteraceae bacterium]|jgi:anti-sigma factor RsiW|nr:zf-HC2 domain-containing protein [Deferribacteraceae bacterium]
MKCERFKEIISAFVDSEASPLEQLALQKHLEVCGDCKKELMFHYKMKNMVQREHGIDNCEDVNLSSAVMVKINALKPKESAREFSLASRLSAAAVILFATLVTMLYAYTYRSSSPVATDSSRQYTSYIYTHVNEGPELADEYSAAQGGQDYIAIPERRISTVSLSR